MPFTLSHPVAAVPLKRLGFSLSGLVVGSMSPDFIYILKLAPKIGYTHTLPGLFTFCLPASWVVLWLYQMLKQPLASLVPGLVPEPMPAAVGRERLKRFGLTSLSILAGACTHIVWDGFTHETGWMVAYFPGAHADGAQPRVRPGVARAAAAPRQFAVRRRVAGASNQAAPGPDVGPGRPRAVYRVLFPGPGADPAGGTRSGWDGSTPGSSCARSSPTTRFGK